MKTEGYKVLARRWRPRRFSELVGQDVVVRTLQNALLSETLAHAYLLTGIRGVGKTTIARLMAMAMNCPQRDDGGEPCNACPACTGIAGGSHLDVLEMDAASHTGVDDIRDILDGVRYPPTSLSYRVYIIDEVHMLSKSAFNALLKTLEEPPARVVFILATTEVEKLPVTVRSRCQRFDLRRLTVPEIRTQLQHIFKTEEITSSDSAVSALAVAADGSMRDALSLAERVLAYKTQDVQGEDVHQALGLLGPELPLHLSDAIANGKAAEALSLMQQAASQGYAARAVLVALAERWHQLACCRVCPAMLDDIEDESMRQWMQQAMGVWSHHELDLHYQVLLHGIRDLALMDEQSGAEMVLLRLCHLQALRADHEPAEQTTDEKKKPLTEPAAMATQPVNEPVAPTVAAPPAAVSLISGMAPGRKYTDWHQVVAAYSEVSPSFTAVMEHVVCTEFDEKVRLSLDVHSQRSTPMKERLDFARWLGREVLWEVGHRLEDDVPAETISSIRNKHIEQEKQRRWQHARQDPHVQALTEALSCRLIDVRAGGKNE